MKSKKISKSRKVSKKELRSFYISFPAVISWKPGQHEEASNGSLPSICFTIMAENSDDACRRVSDVLAALMRSLSNSPPYAPTSLDQ